MNDKPITLIVTIYPPKKNIRKVLVSGAPENEMPVLMGGTFQERHALLDTVYAAVSKRDPQLVTIAEPKQQVGKSKSITAGADDEEDGTAETETTGQLVADETDETVPVSPITEAENLPAIEGDDLTSPDGRGAGGEGESMLEKQILEWKDEDHGQQD